MALTKSNSVYFVVVILVLVVTVIFLGQTELVRFYNNDLDPTPKQFESEEIGSGQTYSSKLHSQTCAERKHVYYVKVPKTGSGTMASILIRFGLSRNLTFALPKDGPHFSLNPLNRSMISPIPKGEHYEILLHHSTYSRKTVRELFPRDTVIIASIREPFSHFLSCYYFFNYAEILSDKMQESDNETKKIEAFINRKYLLMKSWNDTVTAGSWFLNKQSQRFGVPLSKSRDRKYVDGYIRSVLGKDMDLVLVQEYFDESLILLKRRLCWKMQDLVYIPYHVQNSRRTEHVHSSDILRKHRELAVAEYVIYDYFYPKFWNKIWKEGPGFFDEVRQLKSILQRIRTFCVRQPAEEESLVLPSSYWNEEFTIQSGGCRDMQMDIPMFGYIQNLKQHNARIKLKKVAEDKISNIGY